ncbi:hypothetical protein C8F01DRAFT_1090098 [Mycena amicta]|nr:hypothetical protein C8F01DRAFT_1090098 [Mycena amicta]
MLRLLSTSSIFTITPSNAPTVAGPSSAPQAPVSPTSSHALTGPMTLPILKRIHPPLGNVLVVKQAASDIAEDQPILRAEAMALPLTDVTVGDLADINRYLVEFLPAMWTVDVDGWRYFVRDEAADNVRTPEGQRVFPLRVPAASSSHRPMSRPSKTVRFALSEPPVDSEPIYIADSDDDEDTRLYADFEALAIETTPPVPPVPTHSRPRIQTPVRPPPVPTHSRPGPPIAPLAPVASSQSSTALYSFPSSTGNTRSTNWAQAATEAKAAKGVATAIRRNRQKKPRPVAYMVARGHRVCVSSSWDEVKRLTDGFSHNLFEGYPSLATAQAALEWLQSRRLTSSSQSWSPREEDIPLPCNSADDLAGHGPREPSDAWHIVYVGINPGVFPTSAEAAVNVVGVKGGLRDHRDSYAAATEAYTEAVAGGYVAKRRLAGVAT